MQDSNMSYRNLTWSSFLRVAACLQAAIIAAAMASCVADPNLDSTSVILCDPNSATGNCPDGWTCKALNSGDSRCVQTAGLNADLDPPELIDSSIIIDPLLGKHETVFTVCFSVNEELADEPVILIDTGTGKLRLNPMTEHPSLCADTEFAFTYLSDNDRDLAGNRALTVSLVDMSLNPADGLSLGNIQLDFSVPVLSNHIISSSSAKAGDPVTLELVFNEPLDGTPEVQFGVTGEEPTLPWTLISSLEEQTFIYTFTANGFETPGQYSFTIRGQDKAGNTIESVIENAIILDFSLPTFDEPIVSPSGALGPGYFVEVIFNIPPGETYTLLPKLEVLGDTIAGVPPSFGTGTVDGSELYFNDTIRSSDCNQTEVLWDLMLSGAVDSAGNEMLPQVFAASLPVDCLAPQALSSCVYPASSLSSDPCPDDTVARHYNQGDTIYSTINFSETASVEIKLGNIIVPSCQSDENIDCCRSDLIESTVSCWQTVGTDLADGSYDLQVFAQDGVGNSAEIHIGTVIVDAASPVLVGPVIAPNPANASTEVEISLSFSEPVENLILQDSGLGFSLDTEISNDQSFLYRLGVNTFNGTGTYNISISATDFAGNTLSNASVGALQIDTELPRITSQCIYPANSALSMPCPDQSINRRHKLGETLRVAFTVSEPANTKVFIGSEELPMCPDIGSDQDCCTVDELQVECQRLFTEADGEGSWEISTIMVDEKDNSNTIQIGLIDFDAEKPFPVYTTLSPNPAKASSQVTVHLKFSEAIDTLELSGTADLPFSSPIEQEADFSYQFLLDTTGLETHGSYDLMLSATDIAGNLSENINIGTLVIDTVLPEIVSHCIYPVGTPLGAPCPDESTPRQYKLGDEIFFNFSLSEESNANILIRGEILPLCDLGDPLAGCCQENGLELQCQRTVGVTDTGNVDLQYQLEDRQGNFSNGTLESFHWDGIVPTINVFANSDVFGVEDRFMLTVSADEDLQLDSFFPASFPIPDLPWEPPTSDTGNRISWALDLSPSIPSGSYQSALTFSDLAGNEVSAEIGPFLFDTSRPDFENVTLNQDTFSAIDGFNQIQIEFNIGESICASADHELGNLESCSGLLTVALQGTTIPCSRSSSSGPPFNYSCNLNLSTEIVNNGGFSDGIYLVNMTAVDQAGNQSTYFQTVHLDFSAPEIDENGTDVEFTTASTNPLIIVDAINATTSTNIVFLTDEQVDGSASAVRIVHTSDPSIVLDLPDCPYSTGSALNYCFIPSNGLSTVPDGSYDIEANLIDSAGNSSDWQNVYSSLILDRTSPNANAAFSASEIQLLRFPHGSRDTPQGERLTAVVAADFPAYAGQNPISSLIPLAAFDSLNESLKEIRFLTELEVPVGRSVLTNDQSAWGNFYLPGVDYPVIKIQLIDHAGNISDPVTISQVQWVGTIADKVLGDLDSNPLVLLRHPALSHELIMTKLTEIGPDSDISNEATHGDLSMGSAINRGAKISRKGTDIFAHANGEGFVTLATDLARGEVIAIEGSQFFDVSGAIWRRNQNWIRGSYFPHCRNRAESTSLYDPTDGTIKAMCVFPGGSLDNGFYIDSSFFSISDSTPDLLDSQIIFDSINSFECPMHLNSPTIQTGHAMAFNPARQDIIMAGGECHNASTPSQYTSRFDDEVWSVYGSAANAPKVTGAAMVWDPIMQRSLLFGGSDGTGCNNAFYKFSQISNLGNVWYQWIDVEGTDGISPPPLCHPALAYNYAQDRAILYAGRRANNSLSDEVWEWDSHSETWSQLTIQDPENDGNPQPVSSPNLTFDPQLQQMIVTTTTFDSEKQETITNTWALTGSSWKKANGIPMENSLLPSNTRTQAVWDAANNRIFAIPRLHDSVHHEWSGEAFVLDPDKGWQSAGDTSGLLQPSAEQPPLVYHPGLEQVLTILSSGRVYGFSSIWQEIPITPPPANFPTVPAGCQAVFNSHTEQVMRFCRDLISPLWTLVENTDGGAEAHWQDVSTGLGYEWKNRDGVAAAYDQVRHQLVLFGSDDNSAAHHNSLVLDSQTGIANAIPIQNAGCDNVPPPQRRWPAMTYDPGLGAVAMFGGNVESGVQTPWTWNGECWTRHQFAHHADVSLGLALTGASMVYDSALEQLYLVGGISIHGSNDHLWQIDFKDESHPGFLVSLDVNDSLTAGREINVRSASAIFLAGGTGGAALDVWTVSGWNQVASHSGGYDSPEELFFETPEEDINNFVFRDGIHFAARSRGLSEIPADGGTPMDDDGTAFLHERIQAAYMEYRIKYEIVD
jgi:hypothetical protein